MSRSKKQTWIAGDEFLVPLEDGSFGFGQVLAGPPLAMQNTAICAFFCQRVEGTSAGIIRTSNQVISALWVTRDLLDSGVWQVYAHSEPLDVRNFFPDVDERRAQGFIGTKIHGSGIARRLLNAYFCLAPWDAFAEPNYLDGLLLEPQMRPAGVILTKN
jgi:hypothetical protein